MVPTWTAACKDLLVSKKDFYSPLAARVREGRMTRTRNQSFPVMGQNRVTMTMTSVAHPLLELWGHDAHKFGRNHDSRCLLSKISPSALVP